jgi:integrase/recombinase XerD
VQHHNLYALNQLKDYLAETFAIAVWQEVEGRHLQAFAVYLATDYKPQRRKIKLSPVTIRSRIYFVRRFFKWLFESNYLLYNPADRLPLPKKADNLPRVLNETEVSRILAQVEPVTAFNLRDRAMLETLYDTGIRVKEMQSLNIFDVDLAAQTLHIRQGKNKRERFVPLTNNACGWLSLYLNTARKELLDGRWWGFGRSGKQQPNIAPVSALWLSQTGRRLSYWRFTEIVTKYVKKAGVAASAHTFRHSIATHLLQNGADIRHVQQFLGHSNINTTQIYTHLDVEDLRRAMERAAANLKADGEFDD